MHLDKGNPHEYGIVPTKYSWKYILNLAVGYPMGDITNYVIHVFHYHSNQKWNNYDYDIFLHYNNIIMLSLIKLHAKVEQNPSKYLRVISR